MSEAKHCPHCGATLPQGAESVTNPVADLDSDDQIPSIPLLAPGSNDETFLIRSHGRKVTPAEPDPILGEYVETLAGQASGSPIGSPGAKPIKPKRSTSSGQFPSINLEAAPSPRSSGHSASTQPRQNEEDDDDQPGSSRRGWPRVLLGSYASAITLALIWFVMKERSRERAEPTQSPSSIDRPELPRQQELSKTILPSEPILGEHFASFGLPLRVGSLEITPLDVTRQDVKLQRANVLSASEFRDGGKKALVLRLKLRNLSEDSMFAPLDQAYLRDHGETLCDTYVTTADYERVYPFPLAVESEWSIVGQDFRELRPGESRTVAIVTAPDAPPNDAGPFTWRVRLRTGISRTDVIGVLWTAPAPKPAKASVEPNSQ